jgi:hypothetical protein
MGIRINKFLMVFLVLLSFDFDFEIVLVVFYGRGLRNELDARKVTQN